MTTAKTAKIEDAPNIENPCAASATGVDVDTSMPDEGATSDKLAETVAAMRTLMLAQFGCAEEGIDVHDALKVLKGESEPKP